MTIYITFPYFYFFIFVFNFTFYKTRPIPSYISLFLTQIIFPLFKQIVSANQQYTLQRFFSSYRHLFLFSFCIFIINLACSLSFCVSIKHSSYARVHYFSYTVLKLMTITTVFQVICFFDL